MPLSPEGPVLACPDEDALARFVEGILAEPEREALWRHVQTCERCEEATAFAVQALEGGADAPRRAARRSWPRRWIWVPAAALAAVVAGIVVRPAGDGAGTPPAAQILAARAHPPVLPPAWSDHEWPTTRGGTFGQDLRGVSFRVGVEIVDLEAALAAPDIERARELAARLRRTLATIRGAEEAVLFYEAVESALAGGRTDTKEGARAAREAEEFLSTKSPLDGRALGEGKWLEAARHAVLSRDEALLSTVPLDRLAAAADGSLRDELERMSSLVRGEPRDAQWGELQATLERSLRLAGGR